MISSEDAGNIVSREDLIATCYPREIQLKEKLFRFARVKTKLQFIVIIYRLAYYRVGQIELSSHRPLEQRTTCSRAYAAVYVNIAKSLDCWKSREI